MPYHSLSLFHSLAAWSEVARLSVSLWPRPSGDKAPVLPGESPHPAGILPSPTGAAQGGGRGRKVERAQRRLRLNRCWCLKANTDVCCFGPILTPSYYTISMNRLWTCDYSLACFHRFSVRQISAWYGYTLIYQSNPTLRSDGVRNDSILYMRNAVRDGDVAPASNYRENIIKWGAEWQGREPLFVELTFASGMLSWQGWMVRERLFRNRKVTPCFTIHWCPLKCPCRALTLVCQPL